MVGSRIAPITEASGLTHRLNLLFLYPSHPFLQQKYSSLSYKDHEEFAHLCSNAQFVLGEQHLKLPLPTQMRVLGQQALKRAFNPQPYSISER